MTSRCRFSRSPIYRSKIAAIWKAVPSDSAHDELSWRNFPRMKSHPTSKPFATAPVTGHSGEVSIPDMSTPPRPLKTGADRHSFPNRKAIVHKPLERFLSVENEISRQLPRSSQAASLILSFEVGNYCTVEVGNNFMKIITSKVTMPTEIPRVCREGLLDTVRDNLKSYPATVINGRAGTGKTMLAVDFVRRHEGFAAWYKVDASEMSFPFFLEYLVASVARVRPGFGRQTLDCHARTFRSGETGAKDEFDIATLAA